MIYIFYFCQLLFIHAEVLAEAEESDRQGEMEKENTDSEGREDPPLTSGPSGPPGYHLHTFSVVSIC